MPIGRRSTDAQAPPLFCPRCRREAAGDAALCERCGEALVRQGYCGVCDRYWPRPEGEECPKHDVPLGPPEPVGPPAWPSDVPLDWVTVRAYPHPMAAEAPRLRLDAEGIPTFLAGERMGANTLYQVATGGVKLQVPRALLADARVLLAQSWAPPLPEDAIAGDDPDEPTPEPAATPEPEPESGPIEPGPRWVREAVAAAVVVLAAVAAAGLFLSWGGR